MLPTAAEPSAAPETDPPVQAAETRPAEKPGRDPWFDNIKMTLVMLVVVGHSWMLLPNHGGVAYDFLYAWHVPAFVTITGYLSRSFTWTPLKLWRLVRTVAVPYVIFEAALAWFRYQAGGVQLDELFADPHWPMWFLSALFFWRLMTPVFVRMPGHVALATAVTISLLAGFVAGNVLDTARILGLLPFFVLGLTLSGREWDWIRSRRAALLAPVAFAAIALFAWWAHSWMSIEWYYYRALYAEHESDPIKAVAIRAMLLGVGLVGTAACFALVPRVRSWFTVLGGASLVVYLFHGFFVLTAQYEGFPDWAGQHKALAFMIATAGGVSVALFLAAPPVARALNTFVDPIGWLERRRQVLRRD